MRKMKTCSPSKRKKRRVDGSFSEKPGKEILLKFKKKTETLPPPCFGYRDVFDKNDPFCQVCSRGKTIEEIRDQINSYAQFLQENSDLYQEFRVFQGLSAEEVAKIMLSCPYLTEKKQKERDEEIRIIKEDIKRRYPNDSPAERQVRITNTIEGLLGNKKEIINEREEFIESLREGGKDEK